MEGGIRAGAILRLLRAPNLLIVALTQYLLYYRILRPALLEGGLEPVMDHLHLALLVLDTVLITACGYLANDLIDQSVDRTNRPERQVVGTCFSGTFVNRILAALALGGFGLAWYLAVYAGRFHLLLLYPAALAGLMAYNLWLKRLPLLGNLVVAGYCAGVAGILAVAEAPVLAELASGSPTLFRSVVAVLGWYMVFAFFSTLLREMVKDLEDMPGDGAARHRTLPLVVGEAQGRRLALWVGFLLGLFLLGHGWVYRQDFSGWAQLYIGVLITLPLVVSLVLLHRSRNAPAYHRVSTAIKGIMLAGLLLLFLI